MGDLEYKGTGMGSANSLEASYVGLLADPGYRRRHATVVMTMNNAAAAQISMDFELRGPSLTYSTACSFSAVAIAEAFPATQHDIVDCAVAGGADIFHQQRLQRLPGADGPPSEHRRPGRQSAASWWGTAPPSDVRHITKPKVQGQARIAQALAEAGLAPPDIDYTTAAWLYR